MHIFDVNRAEVNVSHDRTASVAVKKELFLVLETVQILGSQQVDQFLNRRRKDASLAVDQCERTLVGLILEF